MANRAVPVEVVIGNIEEEDDFTKVGENQETEEQVSAVWQDYIIRNRFERDPHIYMLGTTNPEESEISEDAVAFVKLSGNTVLWICDWSCARSGLKPLIPDPTPTDPNWVLLDEHMEPESIDLHADGVTALWRISGTYFYGYKRRSPSLQPIATFAKPPWIAENAFNYTVEESQLKRGLIGNGE